MQDSNLTLTVYNRGVTMHKFVIIESLGGRSVYTNLISSPAGQYLSRQPHLINLLREVLTPLKLKEPRHVIEHDMGRNIGRTDIVETSSDDTIYYAQPVKKEVFSRFAKNRYPSKSSLLTIIVECDKDGDYEITDTWIGPASPAFPGDEHETAESKSYWQNHALVQNAQNIQSKTITKDCPY